MLLHVPFYLGYAMQGFPHDLGGLSRLSDCSAPFGRVARKAGHRRCKHMSGSCVLRRCQMLS